MNHYKKNPKTDFRAVDKLGKNEAREEVEALREGIEYHDYLYYVKNKPRISDATYDKLFRWLQELEEAYPDLRSDTSPTRRVGAKPVDELKKVGHKERIQKSQDPFANPRNAAAGIMRQLDSRNVAGKPLDLFFYDILEIENGDLSSHWEVLKRLKAWGLRTNSNVKKCTSFEDIEKYHRKMADQREGLNYEIDGVVIKVDDLKLREKLGVRHRSPRWAMAWKFEPKEEVTRLEDIVVSVGRTGILTPVALLQPVDVGGVTVSRATLHNEQEVKSKDVRVGDKVRVARAGDVIPEVVDRIKEPGRKRGKRFSMPGRCPACGAGVVKEGAYVLCPAGLSCPAQIVGRITHYASQDAMDIETLGGKTVKQLYEKNLVESIADLYRLSVRDLRRLDGFAEKSAEKLYKAIGKSKNPRLDRFVYALGIRHVGGRIAQVLAREFGSLENVRKAKKKAVEKIPEIGPEIAESVVDFFSRPENKKVLDELKDAGVKVRDMPRRKGDQPLEGKAFVFTGSLEHYTREEAQRQVEDLGGRARSSVSGGTEFVVAGEGPGSKLDEARKREVKVLDEKEFEELLERVMS